MIKKIAKLFHLILIRCLDFFYPLFQRWMNKQLYYYLACGAINTISDWVMYFFVYNFIIKKQILELGFVALSPHIASLFIVFPFTLGIGFFCSKYISFSGSSVRVKTQAFRYLTIIVFNFFLSYFSMKLLVDVLSIYPTPSKMITTIFTSLVSFFSQKYYSFRT
mgnify:CR=1 FL=1